MRAILASVSAAFLFGASGGGGDGGTFGWACPAIFHRLPSGWSHSDNGPIPIGPWFTSTTTWASTGRSALLADLPRGGVYVEVLLSRPAAGRRALTATRFVPRPRLDRLAVVAFPKGPPGRGFQRVMGRFKRQYNVDLQVIYERRHPTNATIRRAQTAVDAIRLPRWPRRGISPPCE